MVDHQYVMTFNQMTLLKILSSVAIVFMNFSRDDRTEISSHVPINLKYGPTQSAPYTVQYTHFLFSNAFLCLGKQ